MSSGRDGRCARCSEEPAQHGDHCAIPKTSGRVTANVALTTTSEANGTTSRTPNSALWRAQDERATGNQTVLVLAAHGLLAALRDDTPAVLHVARFPADGKNRTALLSAQGLPGGTIVRFRW
jgi:hypothetical protein